MSDENKTVPVDTETMREIAKNLTTCAKTFTELADFMQNNELSTVAVRVETLLITIARLEASGRSMRVKLEKAASSVTRDRISAGKRRGRTKRN